MALITKILQPEQFNATILAAVLQETFLTTSIETGAAITFSWVDWVQLALDRLKQRGIID